MKKQHISETELILHPDGRVFHLKVKAEHLAETIFLVGDQNRVKLISQHFDHVEHRIENREFITHTGYVGNRRLTAISTGIGTDNMDIVLNELFAAVNINPETRCINDARKRLKLIRLGTSGALHEDIPVGSFILSHYGLGLDGLLYFYSPNFSGKEDELAKAFLEQIEWPTKLARPYFVSGSENLLSQFSNNTVSGITASGTGFYGPQGRNITNNNGVLPLQEMFATFKNKGERITNFDMETSALYGLGKLLGFECCTLNVVIANRATKTFAKNPKALVKGLIKDALAKVS